MQPRRATLWFVVPAHGRERITSICLRQLRRTCDSLAAEGLASSAVVIADDANLDTARELGFGTIVRDNKFLSAKFNDGIQLACDGRFNPRVVDYVVPFGSDDWIDYRILLERLPGPREVIAFRHAAFVDETGTQLVSREIDYRGGVGIRVYPREMMARRRRLFAEVFAPRFRPADEDLKRGCDTSILVNVTRTYGGQGPMIVYADQHVHQIVDWKSPNVPGVSNQLNSWSEIVTRFHRGVPAADPFEALRDTFPDEALDEMRAHYGQRAVVAA